MSLEIKALNCAYNKKAVLSDIDIDQIAPGSFVALVGPNAAGKSTLFKAISGLLPAEATTLTLSGNSFFELTRKAWFDRVCYLPQSANNTASLTVFETILLAKKTKLSWAVSEQDVAAVSTVIQKFQLQSIAHKNMSELSGGQQQLASLCQALVRTPDLYLLDEPTSALDIHRELQVLHALKEHTYKKKIITIVSLHNLTLAATFADQMIVINNGKIASQGKTEKVLNSGVIESTYGVEIEILKSKYGKPVIASHRPLHP